jgi:hypothetical protein
MSLKEGGIKDMKRVLLLLVAITLSLSAFAQKKTGNLAPSGPHYDLNLIGVDEAKKSPLTSSNRHTIFVPLFTNGPNGADTDPVPGNDIWLTQSPDSTTFAVCDGNAFDAAWKCDGTPLYIPGTSPPTQAMGAVFELPCNTLQASTLYPCTGGAAAYTVWGRVVGTPTPGGTGTITTCAYTTVAPIIVVCSAENEVFVRSPQKPPKFDNVTPELTSLVTGGVKYPLFYSTFQGFFWDYDNNGDKVLQLRFYLE